MKIFFDIVGGLGLLGLALGAAIWFAREDDTENLAMAHFIALLPLVVGGLLFFIGLLGRVLSS